MQTRESGSPLLPKPIDEFRDSRTPVPVEEFTRSTTRPDAGFVLEKKRTFLSLNRKTLTVWEALDYLNTLVDDSDPDIDFTQIEHAMQTAEAIRAANQPRWFIVTGLVHDLGKILCLFGEPQWAVVGEPLCRLTVSADRLQQPLRPTIPMARCPSIRPIRDLRARMRPRQGAHVLGTDAVRSTTPSRTTCLTQRSTASLPFVLSVAQRVQVHAPHERCRSLDAEVGARVQSLRPLLEGFTAPGRPGVDALLSRARRRVLP